MSIKPFYVLAAAALMACASSSPRAETAGVFVDGQFYGNINSLQNLTTTHIHEIRFLGAGDAVTRYGMQYGNGVIDIRMK